VDGLMNPKTKRILVNFLTEVFIYGLLLFIYFLAVLRLLGKPLNELFNLNPLVYALATLLLIVVQAVVLEYVTSFMLKLLKLEAME
jgi:hypothetical protein